MTLNLSELRDEPLDDSPSVSAMNLCAYCRCDGLGDEALDPRPAVYAAGMVLCVACASGSCSRQT